MLDVKKAIIPIAGLGTRFLPLSKVISKDLLPLADKPALHYLLQEALLSGIQEIIFIVRAGQKQEILEYIKKSPKLEKFLQERKKDDLLEELKKVDELVKNFTFSFVVQKEQLGDGHAILQAGKFAAGEPCAIFFTDDIIDAPTPCLAQILKVFKTGERPIISLKKLPREKLHHYGIVAVEKIASRLYKIKKIIEKPSPDSAPSDLAVVGRYIITPEVFTYLKKLTPNKRGEIILADAFEQMVQDGKIIYGYEIEGEWLECGDKLRWLQSNFYFSLKHPKLGPELKIFLKEKNIC